MASTRFDADTLRVTYIITDTHMQGAIRGDQSTCKYSDRNQRIRQCKNQDKVNKHQYVFARYVVAFL
jgi:hypothetical protein